MRAAITDGKGRIEVCDVDLPERGDYDCLVRMEACAFCNSTDRHLMEGTVPFGGEYPAILGHESIGVIEDVGAKVRHLKPDDRVLRPYALWPDETLSGYHSLWGGFAEFGKVRDRRAVAEDGVEPANCLASQQKVPPEITLDQALLMTAQKEIWSSIQKIDDIEGRQFLVAGAGVTACLFGTYLKLKGAARVTFAARRQRPLHFALSQGVADDVFLTTEGERPDSDYDALVETTGSIEAATTLLGAVPPGGCVYCYAVYENATDESIYDVFKANHAFSRIDPAEPTAHEAVCGLISDGKLNAAPYITHRFPLDKIQEAWRTVIEKRTMKTVVVFQ